MSKYKKLVSNTLIFGIGTFSSKLLVFLLMPLYTRVLSNEEYGTVDLIIQMGNLMLPMVYMGINNAIIRYGLDKSVKKSDVFTTGMLAIGIGLGSVFVLTPLLKKIPFVGEHIWILFLFLMMSSFRGICSQFVRAKQWVKLYSFEGILSTIFTIFFTVLYLVVLKWGLNGYVLAIITADFLSASFLFLIGSLYRYIKPKNLNKKICKGMFRYSIPLIPTTIFWWITTVSDRFFVSSMVGTDANGLYAVSYKIPTFIILVSSIFMEAWQMSAVTEEKNRSKFFTNVFACYKSVIFITGSILILGSQWITSLLVSDAFYLSWRYVPFLVIATAFSCMVTFLGSVYMVEKKSFLTLLTIIVGGVVNIILNIILIPTYGVEGAAFSTLVSYFIVFIIRGVNTGKYVKIIWNIPNLVVNILLLLLQSSLLILEVKHLWLYQWLILGCILLLNQKDILNNIKHLLQMRKKRR